MTCQFTLLKCNGYGEPFVCWRFCGVIFMANVLFLSLQRLLAGDYGPRIMRGKRESSGGLPREDCSSL